MNLHPLILTYNNANVLETTLKSLINLNFVPNSITVIENGSIDRIKYQNILICKSLEVNLYNLPTNRGWGGAINNYLDSANFSSDEILIIMAHDCFFDRFDVDEISTLFKDPRVIFVYPQYSEPVICYYSMVSSFKVKRGIANRYVRVGNHTALFARADVFKNNLRYDEEFHVYGGEFEIFMQAYDLGFKTASAHNSIIVNPSTDAPSDYGYISHKINSLYYAYKRHSLLGFSIRYLVVFLSLLKEYFKGGAKNSNFLACRTALAFAFLNRGRGMRTYLSSNAQAYSSYKP